MSPTKLEPVVKIDLEATLLTELRIEREEGVLPLDIQDFIGENGGFQCNSCGACCEDVRWALPSWVVPGTTRCKHLLEDKTCAIYEDRPWVCRMDSFQGWEMRAEDVAWGCSFMRNKFYGSAEKSS